MQIKERIKKGVNAYIKNDAKAAAITSVITNKDCSTKDLLQTSGFAEASLGLMPLINNKTCSVSSESLNQAVQYILKENTSGRILYLLCGPSSSGKDTLASYAKHNLYLENLNFSYLDKYTTRKRRAFEGLDQLNSHAEPSGNYEYFDTKKDMQSNKKDISLGYSIYDQYYAFSGEHLLSEIYEDKYLMCIYGRFENIHHVRRKVFFTFKRIPFSILLNAPPNDLEGRILRRHVLSESEKGKRVKEMRNQSKFIENNEAMINSGFDLIIENGDKNPVIDSQLKLTNFVSDTMGFGPNGRP